MRPVFLADTNKTIGSGCLSGAARDCRNFKFQSTSGSSYTVGMGFFNAAGERSANYPQQHSAKCLMLRSGVKEHHTRMVGDGLSNAVVNTLNWCQHRDQK
jgi:hypothetical protein